jgi:WD40 repeat protein
MEVARAMQTATLLNNGRVLVAGGGAATAELYDPTTGRFTSTGSMSEARSGQTATLLADGRVLIVGGASDATAELYDPATGRFTTTGSMTAARSKFTATLLKTGRVLIAGGNTASAAELYDPSTKGFTPTGSLRTNRSGHAATLLPDGDVLVTGGVDSSSQPLASAELYNPATGEFSVTNSLNDARTGHFATLLKNGHVLIAGGNGGCGPLPSGSTCAGGSLTSAETYDPKTRIFSRTGVMLVAQGESSGLSAATLLADGRVLFTGGAVDSGAVLRTAESYDPASGRFALAGSLVTARDNHTMTLLRGGSVLIAGGEDGVSALASAEIYKP